MGYILFRADAYENFVASVMLGAGAGGWVNPAAAMPASFIGGVHGLYTLTSVGGSRVYVGKTGDIMERMTERWNSLRVLGLPLAAANNCRAIIWSVLTAPGAVPAGVAVAPGWVPVQPNVFAQNVVWAPCDFNFPVLAEGLLHRLATLGYLNAIIGDPAGVPGGGDRGMAVQGHGIVGGAGGLIQQPAGGPGAPWGSSNIAPFGNFGAYAQLPWYVAQHGGLAVPDLSIWIGSNIPGLGPMVGNAEILRLSDGAIL